MTLCGVAAYKARSAHGVAFDHALSLVDQQVFEWVKLWYIAIAAPSQMRLRVLEVAEVMWKTF